ncbi:MAG TPA: diacylglycerol kinase family protein, partial [Ktedonobacterales bacterium]|nr:diacylglycerol kinase family protein [Ktedonobacterales bacterium]
MNADTRQQADTSAMAGPNSPVVLVTSAHAGHADGATPAERLRAERIVVAEQIDVSALDHNLPQGVRWRDAGMRAVVAAGGDGTLGAVATQLAGSGLPMGILPMGTSNDSARSLDIPLDLVAACETIAWGVPTPIDAGQALPALTEPGALSSMHAAHTPADEAALHAKLARHGAYFMHALTLGFNVEFARLATDVARRERWGTLTYAASALEALTQFQPVPVTLRLFDVARQGADGDRVEMGGDVIVMRRVLQVAVVNLPVFGGPLNLRLPDAWLGDRLLDFVVIEALEPPNLRATVDGLFAALGRLRDGVFSGRAASSEGTAPAELTDETAGLALPGVHRFSAR